MSLPDEPHEPAPPLPPPGWPHEEPAALAGPLVPPRKPRRWIFALGFALSAYTIVAAGASASLTRPDQFWGLPGLFVVYRDLAALATGLPYAAWLIAILGCHEMGHYLACRWYRIDATPPLFLPGPQFPFGTFGAFIRIRSPFPHRDALFDVGIAGPLAGFAVTIPALLFGFSHSQVVPAEPNAAFTTLGDSLLSFLLARWVGPPTPEGMTLLLHPAAYAGWVGLFATAMNLLPVGQLDGGHVAYAVSAQAHRKTSLAALLGVIAMGVVYLPWAFWGLLLALVLGVRHPPVVDAARPLSRGRRWLALLGAVILALCFIPTPFLAAAP